MENSKTVLVRVSYLLEIPEDEISQDFGLLDKIENKISKDRKFKIDNQKIDVKWNSTAEVILDPTTSNCGRCFNCGQWTTDKENDGSFEGLCNGAIVEGRLLCDECLPEGHPWSF